jgi:hypothetical protein
MPSGPLKIRGQYEVKAQLENVSSRLWTFYDVIGMRNEEFYTVYGIEIPKFSCK